MDAGKRRPPTRHRRLLGPSGVGALSLSIKISMISTPQNPAGVRVTLIKLVVLAFVACELEVGPGIQSCLLQLPGSAVYRQSSIQIFLLAATRWAEDVFWSGVAEILGFFIPCCQTHFDQAGALAVQVAQLGLEQSACIGVYRQGFEPATGRAVVGKVQDPHLAGLVKHRAATGKSRASRNLTWTRREVADR